MLAGMEIDQGKTGRESDKFMLRLPVGMRERLAEAAAANGRSMNAEVVSRLQSTFKPEQQRLDLRPLDEQKAELVELVNQAIDERLKRTVLVGNIGREPPPRTLPAKGPPKRKGGPR